MSYHSLSGSLNQLQVDYNHGCQQPVSNRPTHSAAGSERRCSVVPTRNPGHLKHGRTPHYSLTSRPYDPGSAMQDSPELRVPRRYFFRECQFGLARFALASLLSADRLRPAATAHQTRSLSSLHFVPRAKRVIFLFMAGGPSQLELFDEKPTLRRHDGKPVPATTLQGQDLPFIESDAALMASPLKFHSHGECGTRLSELLPHLGTIVDDIAVVRSMRTDAFNHAPAQIFLSTGHLQLGRPSMGSWVTYGLGSEATSLPAFVVMNSAGSLSGGAACFGHGFLPPSYQGVPFHSRGTPVLYTQNPPGYDRELQRDSLQLINRLNHDRFTTVRDPEIKTRIAAYEMAFRLQASAPELVDIASESQDTLDMYGIDPQKPSFGRNCLLARRLVERGVRFVCLFHQGWDHHSNVVGGHRSACAVTDQPATALVKDLKQRGLLADTIVLWSGEFGRTPMAERNPALGRDRGRDHHPNAFTSWLAGGGVRGGQTIGQTDDLGYHVSEDPVHVHDLQATLLRLLGIDHTRLTFRHQGRPFRLTDVGGTVITKLLA